MAFADYFDKNVQAASVLLQGFDSTMFKTILEQETIGVAYDESASTSSEGRAALDLVVRLLARFYPNISLIALDSPARKVLKEFEALAMKINPNISISTSHENVSRWLVVGASRIKHSSSKARRPLYIGSDNWMAKLSASKPLGSGNSGNPFGAGAAACLGVANVFRAVFAAQLPGSKLDSNINLSVLDLNPTASKPMNPPLIEVDFGELQLVGAGAVGNGFLWALSRLNIRGDLHLIDAEFLERSNLQRYVMTTALDEGKFKAELGKSWLSGKKISVKSHRVTWEEYVSERSDWKFERVAVAVDSAASRIHIQAALPKLVFNSWTQAGEVGVSRHTFLGDAACLACLYMPKGKKLNFDQIVLRALRLPEDGPNLMDVRTRLDTGQATERAFLERISTATSIPIDRLLPFEGKPLRNFYTEAICGGAVLEFDSGSLHNRAEVPMAFQSALAGILLAADVVADVTQLRPMLPTISQIDLLRPLPSITSTPQRKNYDPRCICGDPDFVNQYTAKYPTPAVAARRIRGKQSKRGSAA